MTYKLLIAMPALFLLTSRNAQSVTAFTVRVSNNDVRHIADETVASERLGQLVAKRYLPQQVEVILTLDRPAKYPDIWRAAASLKHSGINRIAFQSRNAQALD